MSDECVFVRQEDNVKRGSKSAKNRQPIVSLTEMSVIPEEDRVFKGCIHEYAVVFILIYVDNTAVRSNCETLVRRFNAEVRIDGSIDLSFYWQSYLVLLGVRYSYDELTDLGSIPTSEKPDLVYIFKFQKLIVELMFLVVNTSPEISYALSVLSRYLTQATLQHGIHAKHLLRYVWAAGMPN
jgi:hypothetical protein